MWEKNKLCEKKNICLIDIVNDNSGQVFINQIYVHPGYKTSNYTVNDIAILKVSIQSDQ